MTVWRSFKEILYVSGIVRDYHGKLGLVVIDSKYLSILRVNSCSDFAA